MQCIYIYINTHTHTHIYVVRRQRFKKTRPYFRYSIKSNFGIEFNNYLLRVQCISFIAVLSDASVKGYPDRCRLCVGRSYFLGSAVDGGPYL